MYAELNACMRKLLGACMWILGACMRKRLGAKDAEVGIYMETLGCMYADFGCKSMERLGACLTVGSLPDSR